MTQPAASDTNPGDLYVDAASRQLWLGVDEAVDPTGSVLVSDIAALLLADTTTLLNAKAYTDAQLLTRAPVSHTHPAAQITDFNAAVQAVVNAMPSVAWVRGMIITYSGSLSDIGVGGLAGWALCDGTTYTISGVPVTVPDLRDRFIIGAGNKSPGDKNVAVSAETSNHTGHTHVLNPTALTAAQLAPHTHGVTVGPYRAFGATYGGAGAHAHGISTNNNTNAGRAGVRAGDTGPQGVTQTTENTGAHDHTCYVDIHVGQQSDTGTGVAGQTHTHTEQNGGAHTHVTTTQNLREAMPYYALAYIMKL